MRPAREKGCTGGGRGIKRAKKSGPHHTPLESKGVMRPARE